MWADDGAFHLLSELPAPHPSELALILLDETSLLPAAECGTDPVTALRRIFPLAIIPISTPTDRPLIDSSRLRSGISPAICPVDEKNRKCRVFRIRIPRLHDRTIEPFDRVSLDRTADKLYNYASENERTGDIPYR